MNRKYKLLLADDHILLRNALAKLIDTFDNFSVEAVACDGKEVIEYMKGHNDIDIVLMDLNMPQMDGFEASEWLFKHKKSIHIIILTMYDSDVALIRLLKLGVKGFLKKDIHPEELKTALLKVAQGNYCYTESVNLKIMSLFKNDGNNLLPIEHAILSDKEIEFIKLASTEKTYREIAGIMNFDYRYIESFRQKVFSKLDVKTRIGLAIYAIKKGILSI